MFTYTDENELLTIEQVCEKLFISHTTAYKLLQSGEIKAFKLGTWKIPAKSVYEYINKKVSKWVLRYRSILRHPYIKM